MGELSTTYIYILAVSLAWYGNVCGQGTRVGWTGTMDSDPRATDGRMCVRTGVHELRHAGVLGVCVLQYLRRL